MRAPERALGCINLESDAQVGGYAARRHVAIVGTRVGEPERRGLRELRFNAQADVGLILEFAALDRGEAGVTQAHCGLGFGVTEEVRPTGVALHRHGDIADRERNRTADTQRRHLQVLRLVVRGKRRVADRFREVIRLHVEPVEAHIGFHRVLSRVEARVRTFRKELEDVSIAARRVGTDLRTEGQVRLMSRSCFV